VDHVYHEVDVRRNLTIQLDAETVRRARILAARRSTSVSRLVATELDRLVREDDAYERARVEALADLERAADLGSNGRLASRDELHDR
jgi:hypothetical protein